MPTIVELGRAAKQAHPGAYDDVPDADLGRAFKQAYPGSYDDFSEATTAGTGKTGARLKGTAQEENPWLTGATATMIGGPILGEAAGLLPLGGAATESMGGLPPMGKVTRAATHFVPGGSAIRGIYDFLQEMMPGGSRPNMPVPPVTFKPVEEAPAAAAPKPWPAPPVQFKDGPKQAPAAPTTPAPAPPAASPAPTATPASGITPIEVPFGQPVITPPETLPSSDWRFEDARDMARLLNQHGLNPADMEEGEWRIAAPALKRNLGVPNARSSQLVRQEWNKLQPRGQ